MAEARAPAYVWPAAVALLYLLRQPLEASMVSHMLLQMPALAAAGVAFGRALESRWAPSRTWAVVQSANVGGATGLVYASFAMLAWMLPRLLDAARLDALVDALKFATVFAAGFALAVSWPRCPRLVRGVVHLEAIATLARFGWGYVAADRRLCVSYLGDDQKMTGVLLLAAALVWSVAVLWRPLFGRPGPAPG